MLKTFFPDIYINSIYELPLEKFKQMGIKALVFDIDNTVAPYDKAEPDEAAVELFDFFRIQGFKLCLLSNNNKNRVTLFNRKLKTLAVYGAGKPGVRMLKKAMEKMDVTAKETAVIGDQVFTDVFCAHNAGALAVYSEPMCKRDQLITKVKRPADKFIMSIYKRRNGI